MVFEQGYALEKISFPALSRMGAYARHNVQESVESIQSSHQRRAVLSGFGGIVRGGQAATVYGSGG
jgi:hypothetical protein